MLAKCVKELDEKYSMDRVIDVYENTLKNNNIISGGFDESLPKKWNSRQKFYLILLLVMYPRYLIHCILYLIYDSNTREQYQFYLLDFVDPLPCYLSRVLNPMYLGAVTMSIITAFLTRKFESDGQLDVCFDLYRSLRKSDASRIVKLSQMAMYRYRVSILIKVFMANMMRINCELTTPCIFFCGLILFHFKHESWIHTILALILVFGCSINFVSIVVSQIILNPLFVLIEVDYFTRRSKAIEHGVEQLLLQDFDRIRVESFTQIIDDFEDFAGCLNKHNQVIQHLIHIIVVCLCPIIGFSLPVLFLDLPFFAKLLLGSVILVTDILLVSCQLYFGGLHTQIQAIYFKFNSLMARLSKEKHINVRIKKRIRENIKRMVCMKQPIGFTFGDGGPSFSKSKALSVLSTTISLTLMVLKDVV